MHIHALDVYHDRVSLIHALDGRVKLALAVLFILSTALTPDGAWPAYVLLTALALGVGVASRLGVGFVQRRAAVAFPFALAAVTVVFSTPGQPLLATQVLGRQLAFTDAGLVRFVSILLKSWLSVQVAVVLTASTPFPALLQAMRGLHLPRVLVAVIGFTYRYTFVIGDEALRLMRARAARSGVPSDSTARLGALQSGHSTGRISTGIGRVSRRGLAGIPSRGGAPGAQGCAGVLWRARVTGGMVGNLFLRSVERSERIYGAMLARGYDGEVRSLRSPVLQSRDVMVALPFVLVLAVIQVLARLPW
jgi:cobalt/nickel transport system permease protein